MCERVSSTAVLDGVTCRRTYWNYSFNQFNLEYQDQGLRSITTQVNITKFELVFKYGQLTI